MAFSGFAHPLYYSQEREALLEESVALEEMLEDLFQWVSTAVASFFEIF